MPYLMYINQQSNWFHYEIQQEIESCASVNNMLLFELSIIYYSCAVLTRCCSY